MSPTLKSLGIDHLTIDERIALAQEIWDSIAEEPQPLPISEELALELDRRWAEHEAHPDDVVPWEQVKAENICPVRTVNRLPHNPLRLCASARETIIARIPSHEPSR